MFERKRNGGCLRRDYDAAADEAERDCGTVDRLSDAYHEAVEAAVIDESPSEAVVGRLSEEFRKLPTEEQSKAKTLAAKRKAAASGDREAQADMQQEEADYVSEVEQPSGATAT